MDRQFWRIWFGRIRRVALVTIKLVAFVIAFCIWPIGLLVLLHELMVCLFPSTADLLSPPLADLFPSLKELFNSKTDPDADLFSRVRMNMVILTAWVGVFFLVWRTRIADKQTQINRESHYTELFAKAVEQLGAVRENGDPAIEMRIGAIYALERLAKDSERDYGPVIETLAAYIREHCRDPKSFDDEDLSGNKLRRARQKWIDSLSKNPPAGRSDVVAALNVLSRREKNRNWISKSDDETQPDFTGANFQGADLWGADLSDANLWRADLSGANLMKADLSDAYLWKANLEDMPLWETNLEGADLSEANLEGADLSEANLENANLRGTDFTGAILTGAILTGADLAGALLVGAQLEDSEGLTEDMIQKAFGDGDTSLPDGLTRPAHWGSEKEAIEKWEAFCEEE